MLSNLASVVYSTGLSFLFPSLCYPCCWGQVPASRTSAFVYLLHPGPGLPSISEISRRQTKKNLISPSSPAPTQGNIVVISRNMNLPPMKVELGVILQKRFSLPCPNHLHWHLYITKSLIKCPLSINKELSPQIGICTYLV